MDNKNPYFRQVELLVRILPLVGEHPCFALKGGTKGQSSLISLVVLLDIRLGLFRGVPIGTATQTADRPLGSKRTKGQSFLISLVVLLDIVPGTLFLKTLDSNRHLAIPVELLDFVPGTAGGRLTISDQPCGFIGLSNWYPLSQKPSSRPPSCDSCGYCGSCTWYRWLSEQRPKPQLDL